MIGYLKGHVLEKMAEILLIEVHGMGYEVFVSISLAEQTKKGSKVELYIHHHVREDAQKLFGFPSLEERQLFREFISVSGVGPKSGLAALSAAPLPELIKAIQLEDHAVFQAVSGIGPKTAKRLVMELRHVPDTVNVDAMTITSGTTVRSDLLAALEQLGYTGPEIQAVIGQMELEDMEVEDAIRHVLAQLRVE